MRSELANYLESARASGRLVEWRLTERNCRRTELYCQRATANCWREVHDVNWRVEFLRKIDAHSCEHGSLVMAQTLPGWRFRIDQLLDSEPSLTPSWSMPGPTGPVDISACFDPQIAGNPAAALGCIGVRWSQLCRSVAEKAMPGHLEAQLGATSEHITTSLGLDVRAKYTSFHLELSLTGRDHEVFLEQNGSFLKDVTLWDQIPRALEHLRTMPIARPAPTGTYGLMVHRAAVAQLLRAAAFDLSGEAIAQKVSSLEPGDRFGPKYLDLWANTPRRGLCRRPVDAEGEPIREILLVKGGRVVCIAADRRYAQLTNLPCTGGITSLRLGGGPKTSRILAGEARSSKESIIEVLLFSHLSTDPRTKSFAGEVRLGRLLNPNGETTPIRGGSVSGNAADVLAQALLSTEAGLDFGNPSLDEVPVHCSELALLQQVSYAGGT
jgi:predicted Zn-dependent protease